MKKHFRWKHTCSVLAEQCLLCVAPWTISQHLVFALMPLMLFLCVIQGILYMQMAVRTYWKWRHMVSYRTYTQDVDDLWCYWATCFVKTRKTKQNHTKPKQLWCKLNFLIPFYGIWNQIGKSYHFVILCFFSQNSASMNHELTWLNSQLVTAQVDYLVHFVSPLIFFLTWENPVQVITGAGDNRYLLF